MSFLENSSFIPPLMLRGATVQTVLASSRFRVMGPNPMLDASRNMVLHTGGGVRLQGYISQRPENDPRGIVILIHGWEGGTESTYILHTGRYLFDQGFDVFRLNLRDHGGTHHLNEGIFYSTLLDEVYEGVRQAAGLCRKGPACLMGFSLGGNFSLRIARRLGEEGEPFLKHVAAVSPVLDPSRATDSIDGNPLLHWYFLKKWKRSLKRKQELFPALYDFSRMLAMRTIREITGAFVEASGLYGDIEEYFDAYTLTDGALEGVTVPMTIITSRDDPAIPVDDFYHLKLASHHHLVIHNYGGHNGFLYGVSVPTWYEQEIGRIFREQ